MDIFDKKHQLPLSVKSENYFRDSLTPETDIMKLYLNVPISVPLLTVNYMLNGQARTINVYPTLQFLYSHHIQPEYITQEVRDFISTDPASFCTRFMSSVTAVKGTTTTAEAAPSLPEPELAVGSSVVLAGLSRENFNGKRGRVIVKEATRWGVLVDGTEKPISVSSKNLRMITVNKQDPAASGHKQLDIKVLANFVRQNPMYTLAAIQEGIYVLGMKEQFNAHDLASNPIREYVQYVADDAGFVLYDRNDETPNRASLDTFGPYFIEQYILMEVLSKQEVAHNVLDYYCHSKDKLQRGLDAYSEKQGKGFVCWRFLLREIEAAAVLPSAASVDMGSESDASSLSDAPVASTTGNVKRIRSGSMCATEADAEIDEIFSEASL